ncbi:MAG: LLM class flavin-dependent oxidoreductase [Actinomycetota bacterium]|nr:LLM class flavin-dependent oxidoreductase [Actinomycetota bacterium]
MATTGYFLATEQYGPADLVEQAKRAEDAGFEALWFPDHFHPWNDEQGQSPFVWGVIGAVSQVTSLPISTADIADAMTLIPREKVAEAVTCGSDPDKHAAQVRAYLDAGVDEVYVQQIGPDMDGFFAAWHRDVRPQLG